MADTTKTPTPKRPVATEKITVGMIASGPRENVSITSDVTKEYVSSNSFNWIQPYLSSRPIWIDDLTELYGDDFYDRMLLDPQVFSTLDLLKVSIVGKKYTVHPVQDIDETAGDGKQPRKLAAFGGKPQRQSSPLSQEVAQFCQRVLDNLKTPFASVCYEILDGVAYGNKVAELNYVVADSGPDAGQIVLTSIKTKPRRSTAFVLDPYHNVAGMLAIQPGQFIPTMMPLYSGAVVQIDHMLPREKFIIFSWRPENNNPQGRSQLRSVNTPWWGKQQVIGEYLKYLTQFAGPSIIGFTAPGEAPSNGVDGNGNPITLTPSQRMASELVNIQNGSCGAFPNGATTTVVEARGDGKAFLEAFNLFDQQIAKGILYQTLATEEGQHQARAAAETHQDTLGSLIGYGKQVLAYTIKRDVLAWLVKYRYGDNAAHLVPDISFGDTEQQDLAAIWTGLAALQTSGYLDPSQMEDCDELAGLPQRAEDWQQQAAQRAADAAPVTAPGVPAKAVDAKAKAAFAAFTKENVAAWWRSRREAE